MAVILFAVSNEKMFDTSKMEVSVVNPATDVCTMVSKVDHPFMYVYRNMNNKWTSIKESGERVAKKKYRHAKNIKNMKLVPPGIGNNVINKDKFNDGQAIPFFIHKDPSVATGTYGSSGNPITRNPILWGGGASAITPQWEDFYIQLEKDFAGSSLMASQTTPDSNDARTKNYITDPLYGPVLEMHLVGYERRHTRHGQRHRDNWHNQCAKEPDAQTKTLFLGGRFGEGHGSNPDTSVSNLWYENGQAGKTILDLPANNKTQRQCYKAAYSIKCQCAEDSTKGTKGIQTTLYQTDSDGKVKPGDPTNEDMHSSPLTKDDSKNAYDQALVRASWVLMAIYLVLDVLVTTGTNLDRKTDDETICRCLPAKFMYWTWSILSFLLLIVLWCVVLYKLIHWANPRNGLESFMHYAGNNGTSTTVKLAAGGHYQIAAVAVEFVAVVCWITAFVARHNKTPTEHMWSKTLEASFAGQKGGGFF